METDTIDVVADFGTFKFVVADEERPSLNRAPAPMCAAYRHRMTGGEHFAACRDRYEELQRSFREQGVEFY